MRRPSLVLALLLLVPLALAQGSAGPVATIVIDVQDDRSEKATLTFDGLRGLTRYESICLPERASETRVYDDLGDIEYDAREENGRRLLTFTARGSSVHVDMTRGPPDDVDHPLYSGNVNFCVPSDSSVVVTVNAAEGHTLFFMSGGATLDARSGTARSDGPMHVFYSYETPLDGASTASLVEVPPFRVFAPRANEAEAREVASLAVGPLRAALDEAGLVIPFDALRVLYTEQTPFAWEAGHYNGHGYVQVKEASLSGDRSEGYPISSVRVLVHESFHAASYAYGKGPVQDDIAWWLEGTAKHAERHADAAMPNATRHCEKTTAEVRCWDFDDRIKRSHLEVGYGPSFSFDADWEPSAPQDDDTRRFYYSYSEYVVSAWIERHGEAEYQRVWDDVTAAFEEGAGCPCREGWLEALLDDPQLFRPWEDVKASSPQEFEALVKPYVKDEEALQRELDRQSDPFASLPAPAWLAFLALAVALIAREGWRGSRHRR